MHFTLFTWTFSGMDFLFINFMEKPVRRFTMEIVCVCECAQAILFVQLIRASKNIVYVVLLICLANVSSFNWAKCQLWPTQPIWPKQLCIKFNTRDKLYGLFKLIISLCTENQYGKRLL